LSTSTLILDSFVTVRTGAAAPAITGEVAAAKRKTASKRDLRTLL
jgi:hypothetical protein